MGATVCRSHVAHGSQLSMGPHCLRVLLPAGPRCPCTPEVAQPASQSRDEAGATGYHVEVAAGGGSWRQSDKGRPKQGRRWGTASNTTLPGAGAPVGTRRRPDPQQGHPAWTGTNPPVGRRHMAPLVPAPAPSTQAGTRFFPSWLRRDSAALPCHPGAGTVPGMPKPSQRVPAPVTQRTPAD